MPDDKKEVYLSLQEGGNHALSIMEEQLSRCDFLVENTMSIADVSLYAYTHVADEGGFDLTKYPAIMDWFKRIEKLEGYTSIG